MPKVTLDEFVRVIQSDASFIAFSQPVSDSQKIVRARVRPVVIKEANFFQIESFSKTQAFQVNVRPEELAKELFWLCREFLQVVVKLADKEIHAEIRQEKVSYKERALSQVECQDLAHNRAKKYLLQEGVPQDFLQALGIQKKSGEVLREKYDKFKQINRFLEIVTDLLPDLSQKYRLIDFGSGKAYLTFALAHLFKNSEIIGVEARGDLVDKCSQLAQELGFHNLRFEKARIEEYAPKEGVDLAIALHACNTATDDALRKAITMQAKAILVAPCCQHEVLSQLKNDKWPILFTHGLLKERFSALLTEALRAEILHQLGYSVDMCEFVDPEHTPKNLLIRAKLKKNPPPPNWTRYKQMTQDLAVHITLEKIIPISYWES